MGRSIMFEGGPKPDTSKRTVEVSDPDVRAARRLLKLLIGDVGSEQAEPIASAPTKLLSDQSADARASRAREEFHNRRRRKRLFSSIMFGEPAWDMLLALYIQESTGPRHTLGTLLQSAGVSGSSGKRWLDSLERQGLAVRIPHPNDARTYYVRLTNKGLEKLNAYFSETVDSGL